ncbi:protein ApaG [Terrihabitans soli]|uniref:Protein ApaG n=1 Tax=Terrihabitans soli TaxID=708113 RepID=A0A6S6QY47_9HYPH|nr:Co2+/Mg2+ efflux protein ApaG [Terrihabitans soli]BCJ91951.1 protein ApaG [Terrihabitans soli]
MYQAKTRDIRITVTPKFLQKESAPDKNHFVWSYSIEIENQGAETVQLVSRYWKITDGAGKVQEVEGPGVVGEQPVLNPGSSFSYTSGVPLTTSSGFMLGHYVMVTDEGESFEAEVPAFSLDSADERRSVH